MISEVIVTGVIMILCSGVLLYIRKSSQKFNHDADVVMTVIDRFKGLHELDSYDVVLVDPNQLSKKIKSELKKYDYSDNSKFDINIVGGDVKKGYDLIHVRSNDGIIAPFHMHKDAEEFVYILTGYLYIFVSDVAGQPYELMDGVETSGVRDVPSSKIKLEAGDFIMLPSGVSHSAVSDEGTEFIIVALPPLEKVL